MRKIEVPEKYDLQASACHLEKPCYSVRAVVSEDLSELMPYVNAKAHVIQYEPDHDPVLIFKLNNYRVALRKHEIRVGAVSHREEGAGALSMAVDFLNTILEERGNIKPSFKARRRPSAIEIYKILPGSNCGQCGEPACMAFAVKLALGRLPIEACTPLSENPDAVEKIRTLLGLEENGQ